MLQPMFDPDLLALDAIRKLSRREYDKLVELGVFEDERIELLRGMLVTMSPQSRHDQLVVHAETLGDARDGLRRSRSLSLCSDG